MLFQIVRRVKRHQLSPGNHDDLVADGLHLRENVGAENDGMSLPQRLDQIPDFNDLDGVQADGRLIQNDDLGSSQQGLGNAHPLPVALGQVRDAPVGHRPNSGLPDHFFNLPRQPGPPQALGPAHKAQIFQRRLVHVEGRLLREIADEPLGLARLVKHVMAADADTALRGGQAPRHDIHGGGLARAVGPQKTVDLPAVHSEA